MYQSSVQTTILYILYCTAIFNSALSVTCDLSAELYLSADLEVTCDTPKFRQGAFFQVFFGLFMYLCQPAAAVVCCPRQDWPYQDRGSSGDDGRRRGQAQRWQHRKRGLSQRRDEESAWSSPMPTVTEFPSFVPLWLFQSRIFLKNLYITFIFYTFITIFILNSHY